MKYQKILVAADFARRQNCSFIRLNDAFRKTLLKAAKKTLNSPLWEPSSVWYARWFQTDIQRELWEVVKNIFGARGVSNRLIASEKLSKVYLLWPFGNYEKKRKTCSTTRLSQRVYKRDFCSHVFANPDGLAISNVAPRDTENIKKEICRVFNQNGLCITIEANKQVINFLDVTFNLNNSTYQPYTKPNTTL